MASPLTKASSILIVGAGTWGCSTALHLARRGYTNVTVLDPYPVPSPISAGNDLNKIVELGSSSSDDGNEIFVTRALLDAATNGWLYDPVFAPYYHDTGYIVAATTPEGRRHLDEREDASEATGFEQLMTAEDFRKTMPEGVLTGDFPGWRGWWKRKGAGWAHARKSMESAANEAKRLGVHFVTGSPEGEVKCLLYEEGDVKGVVTAEDTEHRGDRTILCAGANSNALFDFKDQLRPTAWTLAHIRMSPDEAKLYRNLPVLFNIERGFFMEPDEDDSDLKICDEHPGYCNWTTDAMGTRTSTPFANHQIPKEAETRVRGFLREAMPHLADREFSFARICWCADTPDRDFLISKHPDYPSLVLGVGGSGHGFSYIPAIGGFISDCMEGTLDHRIAQSFRWRPETAVGRKWDDLQERFGPDGSNRVMDFQSITEWTTIGPNL
ncbi:hypothetical protein LTR66_009276 [Elasticomyces elasticus]|nr:hypothetical protein LTR66_009276 [Elasticomyces elasticus]